MSTLTLAHPTQSLAALRAFKREGGVLVLDSTISRSFLSALADLVELGWVTEARVAGGPAWRSTERGMAALVEAEGAASHALSVMAWGGRAY